MNTPSPLVPQGTTPTRGKSTFFFKVLMILTVHVVLIGGMLLQGCKDTNTKDVSATGPDASTPGPDTNVVPPVASAPNISNSVVTQMPANPTPAMPVAGQVPANAGSTTSVMPPTTIPTAPATEAKEYAIASGDTLGAIAKKNGVSLKALLEANPGVNPKKLQIGQKINVPAGTATTASSSSATAPAMATADASDSSLYIVKSGDTLSRIAKTHHTSFKKIMALNDLKTAAIHPGQKLKLPAPKSIGTETPVAATPATATSAQVVPLQPATPAASTTEAVPSATAAN